MELNSLQLAVLQPFVDETLNALEKMLTLRGEADSGFQDKVEDFKFKGYAVVVNTTGDITGRVLIHHYTETAAAIGNKLLKKQKPNIKESHGMDDRVINALADFSNLIMTPALKTLQTSEAKVGFSQPYFLSDTENMDNLLSEVKEIMTVPIRVENIGRFYINYLIHSN